MQSKRESNFYSPDEHKTKKIRLTSGDNKNIPLSPLEEDDDVYQLREAISLNQLSTIKNLIRSGLPTNIICNDQGQTPLHLAAKVGRNDIVQLLLDKGADSLLKDAQGYLPIHKAVYDNHLEVMKIFLEHENGVGYRIRTEEKERSLLQIAIYGGAKGCFDYLLEKYKNDKSFINYQDRDRRTALQAAIHAKSDYFVQKLLDADADPLSVDAFNNTAMTSGLESNNRHIKKLFIELDKKFQNDRSPPQSNQYPNSSPTLSPQNFFTSYRYTQKESKQEQTRSFQVSDQQRNSNTTQNQLVNEIKELKETVLQSQEKTKGKELQELQNRVITLEERFNNFEKTLNNEIAYLKQNQMFLYQMRSPQFASSLPIFLSQPPTQYANVSRLEETPIQSPQNENRVFKL